MILSYHDFAKILFNAIIIRQWEHKNITSTGKTLMHKYNVVNIIYYKNDLILYTNKLKEISAQLSYTAAYICAYKINILITRYFPSLMLF
jgi:hypothetical protein